MKESYSIALCGVGGQGIILASKLLSEAALSSGFDVKQSEVHGMSQRGGSVVSYVRFGKKINSPLIAEYTADYIVSFEKMETLRYCSLASASTKFIIADMELRPISVNSGKFEYPDKIAETLDKLGFNYRFVDAFGIATQVGNLKTVNTVTLAALAAELPIKKEIWDTVLKNVIPSKILEINRAAFDKSLTQYKTA